MGGGGYSHQDYDTRTRTRSATGRSAFGYTQDIREGRAALAIHNLMDPKQLRNGVRESRDSDEHPNSIAIATCFDETGSMDRLPPIFQAALKRLMTYLLEHHIVVDPQLLFAAVGDYYGDHVKQVQVGQFESDIRMDDAFDRMALEGNGGGSGEESYAQFLYFLGRHTATDCFEKRGRKGYAFITGDELSYGMPNHMQGGRTRPAISVQEAMDVFGDTIDHDLTLAEVIEMAKEKWQVFFILPTRGTYHAGDQQIVQAWKDALGAEHVIMLDDPAHITELIAARIAMLEGTVSESLREAVVAAGVDPNFMAMAPHLEV